MSETFKSKHDIMADMATEAADLPGSNWKILAGPRDDYIDAYSKAVKSHRGPNTVALIHGAEKDAALRGTLLSSPRVLCAQTSRAVRG
eukprot:7881429-Alexandrium_andersonii.AAC.1